MFRPRVIPTLVLKGKGLIKTVKFNKKKAKYIGDPINAVKIFNDLESDELVFLDITASNENRCISIDLVKDIGDEAYMPFAVGGGIMTSQQAGDLIQAGAEKIVICTAAVTNPGIIKEITEHYGKQSVIVCIDISKNLYGKYKVIIKAGKEKTKIDPFVHIKKMEELGAGEILINNIDLDGTMTGYDISFMKILSDAVNIPVIACGGAGSIDDIKAVIKDGNASAAAAGSLFVFHGPRNAVLVNYPKRKELLKLFE